MSPSKSGTIGELKAHAYFLEAGFEVFANVSPNGPADLTVWNPITKGFVLVDIKYQRVGYQRKDGTISYPHKESYLRDDGVWQLAVVADEPFAIPPLLLNELTHDNIHSKRRWDNLPKS